MLEFLNNIFVWIGLTFLFMILFGILLMLLIVIKKKTHAIEEFKAWMSGRPIGLYFDDSKFLEWKVVKVDGGLIEDKKYGTHIPNEVSSYVDKQTNNLFYVFDTAVSPGVNITAAKAAEDLGYILTNTEQFKAFREGVALGKFNNDSIVGLKTSIHVGSVKKFLNSITPHNITNKVNMMVARKSKGMGSMNAQQLAITFAIVFAAIVGGFILIKTVGG